MAQNTTSNVTDTTNMTGMNKTPPELAIIPNSFIAKISKDESESAGVSAIEAIEQVTDDVNSQGYIANVTRTFPAISTYVLEITPSPTGPHAGAAAEVDPEESAKAIEQILRDNPLVESAQANMKMTIPEPITSTNASSSSTSTQTIPTGVDRVDSDLPLSKIDVVNADIAIMDTGVNPHPDLNLFRQISFTGTGPEDNCGHGTHVAGTAAAKNNEEGVVSAAPNARIWSVKVLESEQIGNPDAGCSGSLDGIIAGLNYVIENSDSIDVVNLSLGGYCPVSIPACAQSVYEDVINAVIDSGVVVVVAAGNEQWFAEDFVPARFLNVVTVSAITDSDGKCGGQGSPLFGDNDDNFASAYSNFGGSIDIAAPGSNILSTWNDGNYDQITGTSMAAPHVTGVVALYKSLHPDASPSDVVSALLEDGTTSQDQCDGKGKGYFEGDTDGISEPLLYGGNLTSNQQKELTLPQ